RVCDGHAPKYITKHARCLWACKVGRDRSATIRSCTRSFNVARRNLPRKLYIAPADLQWFSGLVRERIDSLVAGRHSPARGQCAVNIANGRVAQALSTDDIGGLLVFTHAVVAGIKEVAGRTHGGVGISWHTQAAGLTFLCYKAVEAAAVIASDGVPVHRAAV